MKNTNLALLVLALAFSNVASANNPDPTPRKFEDSKDDAKVKQELAKRWRDFGASSSTVTREVNKGPGGSKGCNTTVGPSPAAAPATGSGRYGPKAAPSVTVVTGSIINVCK